LCCGQHLTHNLWCSSNVLELARGVRNQLNGLVRYQKLRLHLFHTYIVATLELHRCLASFAHPNNFVSPPGMSLARRFQSHTIKQICSISLPFRNIVAGL